MPFMGKTGPRPKFGFYHLMGPKQTYNQLECLKTKLY